MTQVEKLQLLKAMVGKQSVPEGTVAENGYVITVYFRSSEVISD